jgi:hypothetical protein
MKERERNDGMILDERTSIYHWNRMCCLTLLIVLLPSYERYPPSLTKGFLPLRVLLSTQKREAVIDH